MTEQPTILYTDGQLQIRPSISNENLENILSHCYGLELDGNVVPKELVSYDDRNFLVRGLLMILIFHDK